MKITRVSKLTGKMHTLDIPVTRGQLNDWRNGTVIQRAMPNLTADQREFIKTGVTPEEWAHTFGAFGEGE